MSDQPSDEGLDLEALKDVQRNIEGARDQLRDVGDILRDALAADDLLAADGLPSDDERGTSDR